MKIVIDCFKLIKGYGKSAGIYNLALNLVRNLAKVVDNNDLIVLGNEYNCSDFNVDGCEFEIVKGHNPLNKIECVMWELFLAPLYAKKMKADVIVFPRGFCGLIHPVNDIVIIHDMIPFFYNENFPDVFNKLENAYIMSRLKSSAEKAKKVITISEASKSDILKYSGAKEINISVINNGCNELSYDLNCVQDENQEKYIVAVASHLPHKNAVGIIESYKEYYRNTANPCRLKIIGTNNDYLDEIKEKYNLNFDDDILSQIDFLGFIKDDKTLHKTIADATVFVFLSLAEGFGFPPIEAMQLGVPVICSNVSSLPEVVGDAAILVNPKDYKEVAKKIDELMNDKLLRQDLITKGKVNVTRFSWSEIADKYLKVILQD